MTGEDSSVRCAQCIHESKDKTPCGAPVVHEPCIYLELRIPDEALKELEEIMRGGEDL